MAEVDYSDAYDEWVAIFYPSQLQRVRFKLWVLECRIIGPPLGESLQDPFDSQLFIYLHPAAHIFVTYEVPTATRVEVVRIDPEQGD
ncbi:MAG: hypothetical protein M3Q48_15730 [Actinomycetota bacterium]|nr:hypothetical protein [Actinomycetota bacterium]